MKVRIEVEQTDKVRAPWQKKKKKKKKKKKNQKKKKKKKKKKKTSNGDFSVNTIAAALELTFSEISRLGLHVQDHS